MNIALNHGPHHRGEAPPRSPPSEHLDFTVFLSGRQAGKLSQLPHRPSPREGLDIGSCGIVKVLDDQRGQT